MSRTHHFSVILTYLDVRKMHSNVIVMTTTMTIMMQAQKYARTLILLHTE